MITVKLNEFNGFNTMLLHIHPPHKDTDKIDSKVLSRELGKMDTYFLNRSIELNIPALEYCNVTCTINAPLYWWFDLQTRCAGCTVSMSPLEPHELDNSDFTMERMISDERLILVETITQLNALYETWMNNNCEDSFHVWHGMLPQCFMRRGVLTISLSELKRLFDAHVTSTFGEWSDFFDALVAQGMPLSEYVTGW